MDMDLFDGDEVLGLDFSSGEYIVKAYYEKDIMRFHYAFSVLGVVLRWRKL